MSGPRPPEGAIHVAGSWRRAHTAARLDVVDPATEQVIGRVPDGDAADVDTAVRAARRALGDRRWRALTAGDRAALLLALAGELEARAAEMARTITSENGSPIAETGGAAAHAAAVLRHTATLAGDLTAEDVRPFPAGGAATLVRRVPVGVAALIAPWNFPLTLVMVKLAPALLAGCTVVIKPAPETPYHAAVLVAAAEAAGVPPGVINVVTGGPGTGQALVAHPGVDKVAFTGSTEAGRHIARACGELLRPVTLELGGKSAAVLLPDADLEAFAARLLRTCLRNTGQTCYNATRILAPRERYAEVVDLVTDTVRSAPIGDPLDPGTVFGPVVSARQRERVEHLIRVGVAEGARVTTGGGRPAHLPAGYYVEPTVFAGVEPGMRVAQEEIFGPVLTLLAYDGEDDAAAIANHSRYGLGGVVFGADEDRAAAFATRLETGSVGVNFFGSNHAAPFGGWKDSGLGVEFGREGLEAYLRYQSVHRLAP
ncbi:aldehyde dehydrogenase family protein [Nonomuraea pusilla]|uniref:aldehyde dehydrogenase family protein n=1 Tax=Nonomuraea pusilla TaxID=46177 RepID=UPI00331ECFED